MSVDTATPSVFDAGLPTLSYDTTEAPQDVYSRIRAAQELAPIAIGPLGPEVLSYNVARAILRDPRFAIPPGIHLTAHGIMSVPLWDKMIRSILCTEDEEYRRASTATLSTRNLSCCARGRSSTGTSTPWSARDAIG